MSEYKYPTIGEVAVKATLAERERIVKLLEPLGLKTQN